MTCYDSRGGQLQVKEGWPSLFFSPWNLSLSSTVYKHPCFWVDAGFQLNSCFPVLAFQINPFKPGQRCVYVSFSMPCSAWYFIFQKWCSWSSNQWASSYPTYHGVPCHSSLYFLVVSVLNAECYRIQGLYWAMWREGYLKFMKCVLRFSHIRSHGTLQRQQTSFSIQGSSE